MRRNDKLEEVLRSNPHVDPTALERIREATKRLEDVGIEVGSYRLEHPLGGTILTRDVGKPEGSDAEAKSP